VTTLQAIIGSVMIALAGTAIVVLSHLLLLPSLTTAPLPAPEIGGDEEASPGAIHCPGRIELRRRPQPMPVTSAELVECPDLFNGRVVTYTGEAVGAVLLRHDHAWVHLNDDVYATRLGPLSRHRTVSGGNSGMAISMSRSAAAGVITGNNQTHGTGMEVVGVYHAAYDGDGGAPAIKAFRAEVVRDAEPFTHPLSRRRVAVASVLAPLTLALLILRRRRGR
jgi:hypothetical protein